MKENLKNFLFSMLSICCLVVIGVIIFGAFNEANAADRAAKGYIENKYETIILVGDSRVMQCSYLKTKNRKNYMLVFSNGGGISCINPGGGSRWIGDIFKHVLEKYPKAPVVFALGVNGNGNPTNNANRMFKVYEQYMKNYPTHTYIVSTVGGTNKKTGSYKNKNVRTLNAKLKERYVRNIKAVRKKTKNNNIYFYDLYNYLKEAGLTKPGKSNKGTRDGLHYKNNVYKAWLKDLRSFVRFVEDTNNPEVIYLY